MLVSLLAVLLCLAPPAATAPIRSLTEDGHARLETVTRTFEPAEADGRPVVHLVGVMHVGDKAYYAALQQLLDAQDLVLYEAVKPASEGETATTAKSDGARTMVTQKRLRMLAVFIEKHRKATGEVPATLDELASSLDIQKSRILKGASIDAWGGRIRYTCASDREGKVTYDLISLGSDQAEGGEGPAKDLRFSEQRKLTRSEIGENREGMQTKMAAAMGLEFQLATINYEHANWRNSDLSIEQVQRRLEKEGASGDELFGMLDGTSFPAKIANLVFSFLRSSPIMQATAKLMMIETLSHADELLDRSPLGSGLMKVIIQDRNEEVFRDLARVIREEPDHHTIAIFYGAGHLPDMERRLAAMGYTLKTERWFAAIDLDLKASGLSEQQVETVRKTIRRTFEEQAPKPAPANEKPEPEETPAPESSPK